MQRWWEASENDFSPRIWGKKYSGLSIGRDEKEPKENIFHCRKKRTFRSAGGQAPAPFRPQEKARDGAFLRGAATPTPL